MCRPALGFSISGKVLALLVLSAAGLTWSYQKLLQVVLQQRAQAASPHSVIDEVEFPQLQGNTLVIHSHS